VAEEIGRAAAELGIGGLEAASTGQAFDIEAEGSLGDGELDLLARRLLANPVIQRYALGEIEPAFLLAAAESPAMEAYPVGAMEDAALLDLSGRRRTALDLEEMAAIRSYFAAEGRACTDAELETIAQTWSEHCVHKTFRARIEVRDPAAQTPRGSPYPAVVDNVLKTYIKRASDEIAAPWVLSAFVDNAGVIALDEDYEVSFKVETHNHPSAVEPFGGANTGVGGVIRDVMGVSARPVAVTDVLCFGPPDIAPESLKPGLLHPRRVASGVVAGVQDYGNKMGIPTVNGGVHYDPGYAASPLVYCGCAGIAPRGARRREAKAGDRIVVIGGKTGRDGTGSAAPPSPPW
jgi:phosphoribosylformylglycinamidine synthase